MKKPEFIFGVILKLTMVGNRIEHIIIAVNKTSYGEQEVVVICGSHFSPNNILNKNKKYHP